MASLMELTGRSVTTLLYLVIRATNVSTGEIWKSTCSVADVSPLLTMLNGMWDFGT